MGAKTNDRKMGVKVAINQNAISYVKNELLPIAEQAALASVIPDMNEIVHINGIGNVDVTLKNIKLNRLSLADCEILFEPGNVLYFDFTGLNLDITLDWHYREESWPHIADSGSGEGSTTTASGMVPITVGTDSTGHPTAVFSSCNLDLSSLSIKLHGASSWFYQAIINMFHKKIVQSIQNGICGALTGELQIKLSQFLATIPLQYPVFDVFALDYSLGYPGGLVITSDKHLVASAAGEFFPKGGQPGGAPGTPVAMPDSVTDNHFQIFISDFSVESLGYVAVKSGRANMEIYKDMVPVMAQAFFTTDFYGQYAPGLIEKYGSTDISMYIDLNQIPDVIFTETDDIDVKAGVELTIRCNNSGGKPENAFTMLLSCHLDGDAEVNSSTVYGKLTTLSITASLVQSQVGNVDVSGFNDLIQLAISMGLDAVNEILQQGTPLPAIPFVEYTNPKIIYKKDYAVVATDIHFG